MKPILLLSMFMLNLFSQQTHAASLSVSDAWVRATAPSQTMTAGYFKITNLSDSPVTLTKIPSSEAMSCSMHKSQMVNGMNKMQEMSSLDIPAHQQQVFQSGGLHLMIMGFHHPLKVGDNFPLELYFSNGEKLSIDATIRQ